MADEKTVLEVKALYCSFDEREAQTRKDIDRAGAAPGVLRRAMSRARVGGPKDAQRPEAGAVADAKPETTLESLPKPETTTVFREELNAIAVRRNHNGRKGFGDTGTASPSVKHALTGLCLSGGGVRSATFSLGALQALFLHAGPRASEATSSREDEDKPADQKKPKREPSDLAMIDYVSSVSGGGYLAASLSLGMTRSKGQFPFGDRESGSTETPTTRHLRDNSNYLLAGGIISFLFVYLRGVVAGLMAVLPIPIAFAALLALMFPDIWHLEAPFWESRWRWFEGGYETGYTPAIWGALGVVLLALAGLAMVFSHYKPDLTHADRVGMSILISVILAMLLVPPILIEGHAALLRAYFVASKTLRPPSEAISLFSVNTESLLNWAKTAAPFLFAMVSLALPFIKRMAESAAQTTQTSTSGKIASALSRLILPALALIVPFLLWLFMMVMAITMIEQGYFMAKWITPGPMLLVAVILFLISWFGIDYNVNSLHNIYRDRMSRAFLASAEALNEQDPTKRENMLDEDDRIRLSEISTDHAPFHLINTALSIPGSSWANQRGRNADFFLYSPKFIGGELTGYVSTTFAEQRVSVFNLGSAMAVSGAAVAPNMGMLSVKLMSPTLALLNLRLGRWAANPRVLKDTASGKGRNFPGARYFWREAFKKTGISLGSSGGVSSAAVSSGAAKPFVYLSDGGHIENLGAYELLRRRCRLIICVDGECDPDLSAGALAQLERFARIDLGIRLHIDVTPIAIGHQAASKAMSKLTDPLKPDDAKNGPHVALGLIEYPEKEIGAFLYVKSSLSGDENAYVAAYKTEHPAFPHETTGDQFFSEEQFECYRALGEHIVRRALTGQDLVAVPTSVMIGEDQQRAVVKIVEESLPGAQIKWQNSGTRKPAAQPPAGSKPSARKRDAEAVKAEAKASPRRSAPKSGRNAKS